MSGEQVTRDTIVRIEMRIDGECKNLSVRIPEYVARVAMSPIDHFDDRQRMTMPLDRLFSTPAKTAKEINEARSRMADFVAREVRYMLAGRDTVGGYTPPATQRTGEGM